MKNILALVCLFGVSSCVLAENTPQADNLNWLRRIAMAAHQQNYAGVFVYQSGERTETSRVSHMVDEDGEHERLDTLDGLSREVIRNNELVYCFQPDKNLMLVEKRQSIQPFPSLLPRQLSDLTENYLIRKGGTERVAGFDAQVITLEPKDNFRYTRTLWAETNSGLLLKTNVRNEAGNVVGQFAFTQLSIGGKIDKSQFVPRPDVPRILLGGGAAPARMDGQAWEVTQVPPGFKKIVDINRTMPGKEGPVRHMVFSDGLATVSVFIEPVGKGKEKVEEGGALQGSFHVYTRVVAGNRVTVLGGVPSATVMQVANSVAVHKKAGL
jgi:sigma-E factor negative regulatory protein RseB